MATRHYLVTLDGPHDNTPIAIFDSLSEARQFAREVDPTPETLHEDVMGSGLGETVTVSIFMFRDGELVRREIAQDLLSDAVFAIRTQVYDQMEAMAE